MEILYQCPICHKSYASRAKAEACMNEPLATGPWSVGDIVLVPAENHAWTKGDRMWLACSVPPDMRSGDHFDHHIQHHSWYVITHIGREDREPHRAVVTVVEQPSFVGYVNEQKTDATRIFAETDEIGGEFLAIIDYHDTDNDECSPAWCRHRCKYALRHSVEWAAWAYQDGKAMDQDVFALFIEDNLADIRSPDGATMLEIATSLQATKDIEFRSAIRLEDGTRKFMCDEEMAAKAGANGSIEIPDTMKLELPIFRGGGLEHIDAKFRYTLRGGRLLLSFKLVRPDLLVQSAIKVMADEIAKETERPVYMGCVSTS